MADSSVRFFASDQLLYSSIITKMLYNDYHKTLSALYA